MCQNGTLRLAVSPPYAHRIPTLDNIVIYGGDTVGIRRDYGQAAYVMEVMLVTISGGEVEGVRAPVGLVSHFGTSSRVGEQGQCRPLGFIDGGLRRDAQACRK